MNKIVIIGNTGSGKTTLANKLGERLGIPVHHLDKLFWVQKGGIKQDLFLSQQQEIMKGDSWIVDGNFMRSISFEARLENADTIIFFELPRRIIYWRYIKRYIQFFNKIRPDMGGNHKGSFDWHSIKFIWKYPTKEIHERVSLYEKTKKVIFIKTKKDEKQLLEEINKK